MTKEERQLVYALATKKIEPADFLERFHSSDGRILCAELLNDAIRSKNSEDVEWALIVGYTFGFSDQHLNTLLFLSGERWHFKHEDVVTALGRLKTPRAVKALAAATQWVPEYLDHDESRALAVKAIWAIGGIAGPEADSALTELSASGDPILADTARNQINRRKSSSLATDGLDR